MHTHNCPYCNTKLLVSNIDDEKALLSCPNCKKTLLLEDYGARCLVPPSGICPHCKEEVVLIEKNLIEECPHCHNFVVTAQNGNALIDPALFTKGEENELHYTKKRDRRVELVRKWQQSSKGTKVGIVGLFIIGLIGAIWLYIDTLPAAIASTKAYADMENVWKEFREKNPYNIQIEGIKRYDDNSFVAIISEPSDFIKEDDLKNFFKPYNCEFKTFQTKIGYDGWLKDAVISFNGIKEKDLPKFSKKLSNFLYGTDYKAELINLETMPEHIAFSSHDLNQQVSEEELRQWFIKDKEPLIALEDSTSVTNIPEAMMETGSKLYMSKDPGFIVWVLDKGRNDTEEFRVSARKFSIDSDLIFGAISNYGKVAIIARERCVPLYELPPMRVETLCLLASSEEDVLAQSYERNSLYAGKLNGGKDYAPIYLSKRLWHSEYGSILNITDQMLKSWSENGNIEYIDFSHPKPVDWAFDIGATNHLKASTLTYNWNTEGVGYLVDDAAYSIYAVNRTGSLPVSYIPGNTNGISEEDPVYRAEEDAYDFFSNLSSPQLARVVQYVSMYQIFHNLDVNISDENPGDVTEYQPYEVPSDLKEHAYEVLQSLTVLDLDKRKKLAKDYTNITIENYDDFMKKNSKSHNFGFVMPGRTVAVAKNGSKEARFELAVYHNIITKLDTVNAILTQLSDDKPLMISMAGSLIDRDTEIEYTANRNSTLSYTPNITIPSFEELLLEQSPEDPGKVVIVLPDLKSKREKIAYAMDIMGRFGREIQFFNFAISDLDREYCLAKYIDSNKDKKREWIKCPTIVQSWNVVDSINAVGGHNLSSKISRFKVNRDLKEGQTRRITRDGFDIVEISAKDARSRVGDPSYLRKYGRLSDSNISGVEIPVRGKSAVTRHTSSRSSRGFNSKDHLMISREGKNYTINGERSGATLEDLVKVAVSKLDNGNNHTSVTLEFKSICQDEYMAIVEDFGGMKLKKGSQFSRINCSELDVSNIVTEELSNGNVRIKIAVKPEKIQTIIKDNQALNQSNPSKINTSVWSRVKEFFMIFEVPKAKVGNFIAYVKEYVSNHSTFRRFQIRQGAKERGIDINGEIDALRVAQNLGRKYVLDSQKKEIA